jgi:hypothetical protein
MTVQGKKTGAVKSDELYTVDELKRRLGVETQGLRNMKRAGLKVIHFGRRNYVLGRSVIQFFEGLENGKAENQSQNRTP